MAREFPLAIVTPEQTIFEGDVVSLTLRSGLGDITFLAMHMPFIGTVAPCVGHIVGADGVEVGMVFDGGFVRANGTKVSVIAPSVATEGDLVELDLERFEVEALALVERGDELGAEALRQQAALRGELRAKLIRR
ncbi:MAG: FoF1 ATP synthase subunit delta/epsilon [Acidimicrobiales bacterium]